MKGRAIIPLVLGLGVGLVAVKFLVNTLQNAKGSTTEQQIEVVRATQDIDDYQEVTPEMLEVVKTVKNSLVPTVDRIGSVDEVIGRVTAKSIPANTPILWSMLAPPGTPGGMVGRIPPGFRAVSVKIDEVTGVAYQIKSGDWVDVIVVMDVDSGGMGRSKHTVAEVILQNVQVLAMGRSVGGAPDDAGSSTKPAKSATLLVRVEEAPRLHLAGTRGKITLAMRGSDDEITEDPVVADSSELFGLQGKEAPGPVQQVATTGSRFVRGLAFEKPHSVTVFRNTPRDQDPEVRQITFANSHSRTIVGISGAPINRTPEDQKGNQRRDNAGRSPTGADDSSNEVESDSEYKEVE